MHYNPYESLTFIRCILIRQYNVTPDQPIYRHFSKSVTFYQFYPTDTIDTQPINIYLMPYVIRIVLLKTLTDNSLSQLTNKDKNTK